MEIDTRTYTALVDQIIEYCQVSPDVALLRLAEL